MFVNCNNDHLFFCFAVVSSCDFGTKWSPSGPERADRSDRSHRGSEWWWWKEKTLVPWHAEMRISFANKASYRVQEKLQLKSKVHWHTFSCPCSRNVMTHTTNMIVRSEEPGILSPFATLAPPPTSLWKVPIYQGEIEISNQPRRMVMLLSRQSCRIINLVSGVLRCLRNVIAWADANGNVISCVPRHGHILELCLGATPRPTRSIDLFLSSMSPPLSH